LTTASFPRSLCIVDFALDSLPVRRLLIPFAIVLLLVSRTIDARSESMLSAEIGPQPLAQALMAFTRQTGLQTIYVSELVTARQSKGARAGLSPGDALTQLLDGTGLTFQLLNARTAKIFAVRVAPVPAAAPVTGTRSKWHAASSTKATEGILVTASRSASRHDGSLIPVEDVRTIPASVTALDGDSLATQKLDQITDYTTYLPGLSLSAVGVPSDTLVMVRGIASLTNASSVVYYIDDTPVGSSGNWGKAAEISLDLMPFDLDRFELLRGPQGTSYGAASESGILRYVLKQPDVSRFEARLGADVSAVHGAANSGTSIQAVVNAPIVDERFAVRLNAYDSYTPGYIDNAYTGAKDVNDLRRNGGRIAALWRPSDSLSMKVTAFWDRLSADSFPEVSSAGISTVPNTGDAYIVKTSRSLDDLTQNRAFLQPLKQGIDYYAATVRWNAGSIEIGSATAWSNMTTQYSIDATQLPTSDCGAPAESRPCLMRFDRDIDLEKFTEEVRIASPQGRRMEWSLGAFYNHESTTDRQVQKAFDTSYYPIAPFAPDLYPVAILSTFEASALFGETTWRITDRLDLTGGVRYDHDRQEVSVLFNGTPFDSGQDSDGVTTWTAAARYRITPDVMAYGRVATGFQPASVAVSSDPFPSSKAERLTSYEAGLKSEFLDHRALFDVSVYYIDWADIQIGDYPYWGAISNRAQATSQGGELISSYSPLPGLKLGLNAAFTQCEFTEVYPAWLLTGYQVPQVPKWSIASTADYDWSMSNVWHAHVGGNFRWIGRQWGLMVMSHSHGGFPTIEKPSYSVLDLNAGIAKDRLAIKVFARNLLDTRAVLHNNVIPPDAPTQAEAFILQPRTIGVGFEFSL
jgi:outer membrane receptor protein involved in Fe transport